MNGIADMSAANHLLNVNKNTKKMQEGRAQCSTTYRV